MVAGRKKVQLYKIQVVNSLLDNIHGFIGLTNVENAIEKLPIFKRLQGVSQLGLTNRIFPCALHNRYIHSLGVLYIVDQMAIKLNFDDDERQIIRLAAMLHDIGHYPFSHDVEAAYISATAVVPITQNEELQSFAKTAHSKVTQIANINSDIEYFMNGTANKCHHEVVGTVVIQASSKIQSAIKMHYIDGNKKYSMLDQDQVLKSLISDICAIIVGNAQHESEHFSEKFSVMVQILHSELDADRIDYLLRDATFSGASYGSFDVGMLIQCLEVAREPLTKTLIVGVNLKGICCAEQLLINRYFAYNQVIYHKYTSVLGCVLQSVVGWMIQARESGFIFNDITEMAKKHESDSRFLSYTDASLISKINDIDIKDMPCPATVYKLVQFLKDYQALDMNAEAICSGIKSNELMTKICESDLFKELDDKMRSDSESVIDEVYQYREMKLTKHIPKELFDECLKAASANGSIEEDMINSYQVDRLQDGIAVIEKDKDPYLLIDSERSMIRDIYELKYCILRAYKL